jgi:hypothetical protein
MDFGFFYFWCADLLVLTLKMGFTGPWRLLLVIAAVAATIGASSSSTWIDMEAPVISLELDAIQGLHKYATPLVGVPCNGFNGNPLTSHPLCRLKGKQEAAYQRTCVAKEATANSCVLPSAAAYDHHVSRARKSSSLGLQKRDPHDTHFLRVQDGKVKVSKSIYLVNNDGMKGSGLVHDIDWNLRGEYILKYDAVDAQDNKAEQVRAIGEDLSPRIASLTIVRPLYLSHSTPFHRSGLPWSSTIPSHRRSERLHGICCRRPWNLAMHRTLGWIRSVHACGRCLQAQRLMTTMMVM